MPFIFRKGLLKNTVCKLFQAGFSFLLNGIAIKANSIGEIKCSYFLEQGALRRILGNTRFRANARDAATQSICKL